MFGEMGRALAALRELQGSFNSDSMVEENASCRIHHLHNTVICLELWGKAKGDEKEARAPIFAPSFFVPLHPHSVFLVKAFSQANSLLTLSSSSSLLSPGPDGQSQWEHPSIELSASNSPPPSSQPPVDDQPLPSHNPKRRQYAAAQAAYLSSNNNGPGGTFDSSTSAPIGDHAASTFVPAYGDQPAPVAGGAPSYGYSDVKSAGGPGAGDLAGQFGGMGISGQQPAPGGLEGDLRVSSLLHFSPPGDSNESSLVVLIRSWSRYSIHTSS